MPHYFFKCSECGTEFDASFIEDNSFYLCPRCGKSENQQPLRGVLNVEYGYDSLSKFLSKEKFLSSRAGCLSSYPELLPLEYSGKNFLKIDQFVNGNLILPAGMLNIHNSDSNEIWIMDDTRNPTFSFKDRASILVALKAVQNNISDISAASTGNAGSSLAGICARLGLRSHIFVPERIPEAKRIQIQLYGAGLYIVQGDYDLTYDICLEISGVKKWYNRNTAYNPLTIEGKKTAAYDLFITQKGQIPDYIFIPSGDGVILSGVYKGFYDLLRLGWIDKLPKLICVQAEGSSSIVEYINTNQFTYSPADSIADSICAGAPRNLFMATHSVKSSCGEGIRVTDKEITAAQISAAKIFGILVEPAAAASLAGYLKYKEIHENLSGKKIALMFTGNGMKDTGSFTKHLPVEKSYSIQELKKLLLNY